MNSKILLLTDSLALSREAPEFCAYEDTWPVQLMKDGFSIHQVSIGGATSSDLLHQISYHQTFRPDYVIVQVGIVDCVPRFATKFELTVLRKLGIVGKVILKALSTKKIRLIRKTTYVKPKLFAKNIALIESKFDDVPVYFIGILPASAVYEKLLPGVAQRIFQYNTILSNKKNFISTVDFNENGIMSDHHHLNAAGHKQIHVKILSSING